MWPGNSYITPLFQYHNPLWTRLESDATEIEELERQSNSGGYQGCSLPRKGKAR